MARHTKVAPLDFSQENRGISELLDHVAQIVDLTSVLALANWDQNTAMPDGAVQMRGNQLATLQGLFHELWTAERLRKVLEHLGDVHKEGALTDADKGLVREARRGYERATKLPRTLVQELARVRATGFDAWHKARSNSDFALQREVADYLGCEETRYNALPDQ
jgi:carboxypeptidase Taq